MKQDGLKELIQRLMKLNQFLIEQDGKEIMLDKESISTKGPYLHQDTETQTEEESAAEERKNPRLFAFQQSLREQIEDIF